MRRAASLFLQVMSKAAVFGRLADLIYPRNVRCALCDIELGEERQWNLCSSCVEGFSPIIQGGCRRCGRLVGAFAWHDLCPVCQNGERRYSGGVSAFSYNDRAQEMIHGLKYLNKPWLAHSMAGQMAAGVRGLCINESIDMLVSVPVHPVRRAERGFNQAELLAEELALHRDIPRHIPILTRIKQTEEQNKLNRMERVRNVEAAFCVRSERKAEINGKRLLLVDDVLTTGSTLNSCAATLVRAGAENVYIATYASVAS